MDYRFTTQRTDISDNKRIRTSLNQKSTLAETTDYNESKNILISEGGERLNNYVDWLGLGKDPNLIVLSSQHHYYYTVEDLKKTNTIVNLKQLNQVKNLDVLMQSIFKLMRPKSNFVGFFADNRVRLEYNINGETLQKGTIKKREALENGIISKFSFINLIYNFIDSKTNRYMTRRDVTNLMETHGFKILDMTEQNGIIYFCAQKNYAETN